jgi:hypothetical protein
MSVAYRAKSSITNLMQSQVMVARIRVSNKYGAVDVFSARNRHCTVTTDKVLAYSKTQNDFSRLLNAMFAATVF